MVKKVSRLFLVTTKKIIQSGSDRGDGPGAPVAVHMPNSPVIATGKREGSKIRLPNGNYLEETASYFVMVETKSGGYTPAFDHNEINTT